MKLLTILLLSTMCAVSASAAPKLRLGQTAITVNIAPGSDGAVQMLSAYNAGDGTLNLQVTSSAAWAIPTTGPSQPCIQTGFCYPIQVTLHTASLAKGSYTAFITVSDLNAIDAPQNIVIVANIGSQIPDQLDLYVPPGGTTSRSFMTQSIADASTSGASWLSLSGGGMGTFGFRFNSPLIVNAAAAQSMAAGNYTGSFTVSNSTFAPDNKTVPVTLHVTSLPILQPSQANVVLRVAQGTKQSATITVANTGMGTLFIGPVTTATSSGTGWLSAMGSGTSVQITVDASSLSPGTYDGAVSVASSAANSPVTIPVEIAVIPTGPPVTYFGGVVNNASFDANGGLAQGDITAAFGEQFTSGDPVAASSLPLSNSLGGVQVFLNNNPVPLYYVTAGQIDFQVPYDAPTGDALLRVDHNGVRGNTVSLTIAPVVPRILQRTDSYGLVVKTDGNLAVPATPAKLGDTVTIYSIGLGATSPAVASGAASPGAPQLALVAAPVQVCFNAVCVNSAFAGLTPNFVGLYQVNVTIPTGAPTGDQVPVTLKVGSTSSPNTVLMAIH